MQLILNENDRREEKARYVRIFIRQVIYALLVYCDVCYRNDGAGSPGKLSVDEIRRFCTRLDAVPCRIKEADTIRVCRLCWCLFGQEIFIADMH